GEDKDSLVLENIGDGDAAEYTVQVMGDCDTVVSDTAQLFFYPVPVITIQPSDILQCPGTYAVFRGTAGGAGSPVQFAWAKNGSILAGENTDSLTFNAISYADTGTYYMIAIGPCDSIFSDTVHLQLHELTA